MKKKILIGSIISLVFLVMPSVIATNTIITTMVNSDDIDENQQETIREKFLVFGFYPDTYRNWYYYYIIPGILYRGVPEYALIWYDISYSPGPFLIIGISNERPTFGIGKIPN